MANINKLRATWLLIKASLFPVKRDVVCFSIPEVGSAAHISPEEFSAALADIKSLLHPDGILELHFDGALALAAPFLLYRLKSAGYSGCRAAVTPKGIVLTGRR
jgi:hypothetical protein